MKAFLAIFTMAYLTVNLLSCTKECEPIPEDYGEVFVNLFEDNNFGGNNWQINPFKYDQGECFQLSTVGANEEVSSLRWSLPEGVVILLRQSDDCGNSKTYELRGSGEDPFLSNSGFDNLANSLQWTIE